MSTRLTNSARDRIIKAILSDAFKAKEEALAKKQHALAARIFDYAIGEEMLKILAALPNGVAPETKNFDIRCAGSWKHLTLREWRRVPYKLKGGILASFDGGTEFADAVFSQEAEEKDLREKKEALQASVRAVVYSAWSAEKLVELWPEAEAFIPVVVPAPGKTVPAVLIPTINAALAAVKAAEKVRGANAPRLRGGKTGWPTPMQGEA